MAFLLDKAGPDTRSSYLLGRAKQTGVSVGGGGGGGRMSCPENPEGPGDQQSWGSALPTPRCLICHMTLSKLFSTSEPQLPPLGNSQPQGHLRKYSLVHATDILCQALGVAQGCSANTMPSWNTQSLQGAINK